MILLDMTHPSSRSYICFNRRVRLLCLDMSCLPNQIFQIVKFGLFGHPFVNSAMNDESHSCYYQTELYWVATGM